MLFKSLVFKPQHAFFLQKRSYCVFQCPVNSKAIKSSCLLGPFWDLKFWRVDNYELMHSCLLLLIWTLLHHNTQPVLIFFSVRIFHVERLEKVIWFHSFVPNQPKLSHGKSKQVHIYQWKYFSGWTVDDFFMVKL